MKKTLFAIVLMAILSTSLYSQSGSINNTLGSGGSFIIKDGASTFLTLDQATGFLTLNQSLSIPYTTSSTIGVIYKGAERFIHTYQPSGSDGGNTFVGTSAGNFTMSGAGEQASWNSAFGATSLQSNTTGFKNSAFGVQTLRSNTSGYQNSAFGFNALYSNSTGYHNSAFGETALVGNNGNNNSAFGYYAGNNVTTGANLTLLGYNAQPSSGTATNEFTLGNGSVGTLRCAVTSITSLSDARDKKNIKDLRLGIDFLMKLKPRQFNWDKREWYARKANGTKMQQTPTAGFIAQELDKLQTIEKVEWLNLVLKENPNRLEATMGNLLPIIVKAVQEVKEENDKFKNEANERIGKLEKENKKLAEMNLKLHKDIASLSSSITDQVREAVKAVLLKSTRSDDAAVKVSMNTK